MRTSPQNGSCDSRTSSRQAQKAADCSNIASGSFCSTCDRCRRRCCYCCCYPARCHCPTLCGCGQRHSSFPRLVSDSTGHAEIGGMRLCKSAPIGVRRDSAARAGGVRQRAYIDNSSSCPHSAVDFHSAIRGAAFDSSCCLRSDRAALYATAIRPLVTTKAAATVGPTTAAEESVAPSCHP